LKERDRGKDRKEVQEGSEDTENGNWKNNVQE
jgi:hypothetical protein